MCYCDQIDLDTHIDFKVLVSINMQGDTLKMGIILTFPNIMQVFRISNWTLGVRIPSFLPFILFLT